MFVVVTYGSPVTGTASMEINSMFWGTPLIQKLQRNESLRGSIQHAPELLLPWVRDQSRAGVQWWRNERLEM